MAEGHYLEAAVLNMSITNSDAALHLTALSLIRNNVVVPDGVTNESFRMAMSMIKDITLPATLIHKEAALASMVASGQWAVHRLKGNKLGRSIRATLGLKRKEWQRQGY